MSARQCTIEGCDLTVRARGWCAKHYVRWQRHGTPFYSTRLEPGTAQRYFEQAMIGPFPDECIIWPYGQSTGGYGRGRIDGKMQEVHSLACSRIHGPAPSGYETAHGPCHNRLCFNPLHLSWKTRADNIADRERDGTVLRGEIHPVAKLTEEVVRDIRWRAASGEPNSRIASTYSIDESTVRRVVKRQGWRHVD